eukprot:8748-Heterococcus_DN1.PRE.3
MSPKRARSGNRKHQMGCVQRFANCIYPILALTLFSRDASAVEGLEPALLGGRSFAKDMSKQHRKRRAKKRIKRRQSVLEAAIQVHLSARLAYEQAERLGAYVGEAVFEHRRRAIPMSTLLTPGAQRATRCYRLQHLTLVLIIEWRRSKARKLQRKQTLAELQVDASHLSCKLRGAQQAASGCVSSKQVAVTAQL